MKKYILFITLFLVSYVGNAQQPTTPQVEGYISGKPMYVSFPFKIKGVPFSKIPNSVWSTRYSVVAEMNMTYYLEGDPIMYRNKRIRLLNPRSPEGNWAFDELSIEANLNSGPFPKRNRKVEEGKTTYSLSVYQSYGSKRSLIWTATVYKVSSSIIIKTQEEDPGPKVLKTKDKVILNPQPILPRTKKKKGNQFK